MRYLSNDAVALIADESKNILNREYRLFLSTNLEHEKEWKNVQNTSKFPPRSRNKRKQKTEKRNTSTRQSCSIKRLIQRVPGIGLVLTTLYFPFGFHTSI